MRRPLLLGRPRRIGCLCRLQPLREHVESGAQRSYFLLLPVDDIAEVGVGALQERYFCFYPLDCIAAHSDSVTTKTKLEVLLYPKPAAKRRSQARPLPQDGRETAFSPAPQNKSNTEFKPPASLAGDVFTCRDRATTVRSDLWSATGNIVTTGNIKTWPHRHRFTTEEYNWMAEIGLLNGEPAVELIEGEIIHMAPMGMQHGNVVERLQASLTTALSGRAVINIQHVFRLSNITEAQPDLIVLQPGRDYHSAKFPTGSDTLLVIEVSDTTFSYDHDIKVPLYAAHDVPEVWIVDLESRCVRFFRALVDGRYTDVQVVEDPGLTKLAGLPDTNIDLSGLLI